jgi:predicted solute-binding protein
VWGLEHGLGEARIALSFDVPSGLARSMAAGSLDVALLPVVELARTEGLELVPGLGITTFGPARSVLLACRRPPDEVATLAHDPDSRTSNVLAAVLLDALWGRRPALAGPVEADAVVRIGDKALFEPVPTHPHVVDLGEAWTRATGLPFVFAAWAARPGVVDRELYLLLHESRRRGARAVDEIARRSRDPQLVARYLRENIRYRLGAVEMDGLRRFLHLAAAIGAIDAVPRLRLGMRTDSACHEIAGRSRG